jgi:hypothetical protein
MVIFQTEENKKSLLYTCIFCAVLLLLFYFIEFNKQAPAKVLNLPEIVTITPDPPLPMPELKDDAGGKSNIPSTQPGKPTDGAAVKSSTPQPAPKESSAVKSSERPDPRAAEVPATTESTRPKVRTMGSSTTISQGSGDDDFGNNSQSSSNTNGTNGGIRGNGSPYGSGENKIPGSFNNKLPSDVDFAGAVYVKLKVGADGIPIEFINITRATDLNPTLKASIIADIKVKLRNLRCKTHSAEYIEEFKFVYKKS